MHWQAAFARLVCCSLRTRACRTSGKPKSSIDTCYRKPTIARKLTRRKSNLSEPRSVKKSNSYQLITIASYIVTLLLVAATVTAMLQMLFGFWLRRFLGPLPAMLFGSVVTWAGISFLWRLVDGKPIPIAVLGASIVILMLHGSFSKDSLTGSAKWAMAGEMWAIVVVAIFSMMWQRPIRWF